MELVTGRKGSPHVTSQQDRMKNQGIFGADSYILNTGKNLAPEVQSSNEIRIRDGAIMVQGALGAVKVNTYDSVTIQNGNQGMKRIDLICWQYTYEAERDTESADWIVIQGGRPATAGTYIRKHTGRRCGCTGSRICCAPGWNQCDGCGCVDSGDYDKCRFVRFNRAIECERDRRGR